MGARRGLGVNPKTITRRLQTLERAERARERLPLPASTPDDRAEDGSVDSALRSPPQTLSGWDGVRTAQWPAPDRPGLAGATAARSPETAPVLSARRCLLGPNAGELATATPCATAPLADKTDAAQARPGACRQGSDAGRLPLLRRGHSGRGDQVPLCGSDLRIDPSFALATPAAQLPLQQPTKIVGWAAVLSFFFGPLGMLYAAIVGAIIMGVIWIFVAIATLGLGLFVVHPVCAVWAALPAQGYNKQQW